MLIVSTLLPPQPQHLNSFVATKSYSNSVSGFPIDLSSRALKVIVISTATIASFLL